MSEGASTRLAPPSATDILRARRILARETGDGLRHPEPYARAHEILGRAHAAAQRHSQAADQFARAIRLKPTASALAAYAATLWPTGQYRRRLALLEQAIAIAPDVPEYRAHRAEMLLTLGRWTEAWPEYERRHEVPGFQHATGCQTLGLPRWTGEPLAGRTIIVVHEGGYGDALHFVRYGPLLKACGAGRTIFRTPATLVRLLQTSALFDEVCDNDAMPPAADVEVPLMSLPGVFGTTPDTIPWWGPYLPDNNGIEMPLLSRHTPPRIGLVWQGAPHNPTDGVRSIPPVELARWLGTKPPGHWVALQFGPDWARMLGPVAGFRDFVVWPQVPQAWHETAQLVAGLDLLVSVDTAMVHLAGAMGIPCWMLLAGSNDWRWLESGEATPWYPSVRLLRMRRPGDWHGLLGRVRTELEARYG